MHITLFSFYSLCSYLWNDVFALHICIRIASLVLGKLCMSEITQKDMALRLYALLQSIMLCGNLFFFTMCITYGLTLPKFNWIQWNWWMLAVKGPETPKTSPEHVCLPFPVAHCPVTWILALWQHCQPGSRQDNVDPHVYHVHYLSTSLAQEVTFIDKRVTIRYIKVLNFIEFSWKQWKK